MPVATESTLRPPFVVTLVVLPEPPERPVAAAGVLVHHVGPIAAGEAEPPDGEPTWEDAAWY
jgi:hypothetical protein